MPYWNARRKKWTAQVIVSGQRHSSQHGSKSAALRWEADMKRELEESTLPPIRTVSLLEWATMYLDHAQAKFIGKTYSEKRIFILSPAMLVRLPSLEKLRKRLLVNGTGERNRGV